MVLLPGRQRVLADFYSILPDRISISANAYLPSSKMSQKEDHASALSIESLEIMLMRR
jgi:hypothetical protein